MFLQLYMYEILIDSLFIAMDGWRNMFLNLKSFPRDCHDIISTAMAITMMVNASIRQTRLTLRRPAQTSINVWAAVNLIGQFNSAIYQNQFVAISLAEQVDE